MPPAELAHERVVLGAVLDVPGALLAARELGLTDRHMYHRRHAEVFAAAVALAERGDPVGPVSVLGEVQVRGRASEVDGPFLHTLMRARTHAPGPVEFYAERVLLAAAKRAGIDSLTLARQRLHAADLDDVDAVLARVAEDLHAATASPSAAVDSWAPVDLGPYLRGEVEPVVPSVGIARSDGVRLLYPGLEHAVIGEMESGKSWVAVACAAVELLAGRHVVYAHFEESDPGGTLDRLRALGVGVGDLLARFRFVGPERAVTAAALGRLLDPAPSLVVLDGVNEALALHGDDANDTAGAAAYRRRLVRPCTAVGAAVLSLDHVAKDPERRGRGPMGSVAKGNGISGSLILLENAEPFGRGARGRSHVLITKDRPGHLRRHGRPSGKVPGRTYVGELVVDDTQTREPDLSLRFWAPKEGEGDERDVDPVLARIDAEHAARDDVHAVLVDAGPDGVRSERDAIAAVRLAGYKHRDATIKRALDDLVVAERAERVLGRNSARGYRALVPDTAPRAAQDQVPEVPPECGPPVRPPKEGAAGRTGEGAARPHRAAPGRTDDQQGSA